MFREEIIRKQILEDLEQLHGLILRYAHGDPNAREKRDRLMTALQIIFAFWRAALRDVRDP